MSRVINVVGQKFGRLTVTFQYISYPYKNKKTTASFVIAECECGKIIDIKLNALKCGNTSSCGCLKNEMFDNMKKNQPKPFKNYVGKKYGMLTVLSQEIAPDIAKNGRSYLICKCKCDCGNIKDFPHTYIRNSSCNPSCGCRIRSLESRQKSSQSICNALCKIKPEGYIPGRYLINKRERYVASKSPEYKFWRQSVLSRDKYTCQGCGKKSCDFHVHHIKEWCNYPELRYDINNGLTLCIECHKETDNYGYKAQKGIL